MKDVYNKFNNNNKLLLKTKLLVKKEIKYYNLEKIKNEKLKNFNDNLLKKLEVCLDKYEILENSEIDSVSIAIVYNYKLKNDATFSNSMTYGEKINLYFVNNKSVSKEQTIKNYVFNANLDYELKNIDLSNIDEINTLNVLVIYNEKLDNIDFLKKIEKNNLSFNNNEGLANFTPIEPKYSLEQVILNDSILNEIRKTLIILKQKELIYNNWGFGEIDPTPKAIMNFYGPSGAGKTMTAHAISKEIGCKLLALNYAEIESKFVGDAPKNLIRCFETADKENALLFFDEADSFLGKRITNVSSSSDQAVNSLRSQMLILLENFNGYVIFATNLLTNYDKAFESRIFKHIKFELPDQENRKRMIEKMIPKKTPLKDEGGFAVEYLDKLSDISGGFSGREIKNAVLEGLCNAVIEGREYVKYEDFINAFTNIKETKNKLEEERNFSFNSINSIEKKKALENKIKEELNKQNKD